MLGNLAFLPWQIPSSPREISSWKVLPMQNINPGKSPLAILFYQKIPPGKCFADESGWILKEDFKLVFEDHLSVDGPSLVNEAVFLAIKTRSF